MIQEFLCSPVRRGKETIHVQPAPGGETSMPPPAVFARYMRATDALGLTATVDPDGLEAVFHSRALARRAVFYWAKHHLAVRLRHGDYALVDPSVAVRAWVIPDYYAEILTVSSVLSARKIDHAFACLTATINADYVPESPILVTTHEVEESTDKLDAFRYDFPRAQVTKVKLDVIGVTYEVPILSKPEAAIVFAAMGTPRARRVARELAQGREAKEDLALKLNHYGIRTNKRVFKTTDPRVTLPIETEQRRRRYADSLSMEDKSADG